MILLSFSGFRWVSIGFAGLLRVKKGFIRFKGNLMGFKVIYWVLLGFMGFMGYSGVLLTFTGFLSVLTEFNWVLLGFYEFQDVFFSSNIKVFISIDWVVMGHGFFLGFIRF